MSAGKQICAQWCGDSRAKETRPLLSGIGLPLRFHVGDDGVYLVLHPAQIAVGLQEVVDLGRRKQLGDGWIAEQV